ncbi:MAG: PIG-L family deacetylase [Deltaproteobacteria bacterium]|nr:PIG-L family deacetylase [Deltaproteobacteria bacterium]
MSSIVNNKGPRRVAVIAAHPDDEVLGCGGVIARHVAEGDTVAVLILAEGLTSRDPTRDVGAHKSGLSQLRQAAEAAHAVLGTSSLVLHDFPDNRMDTVALLDVVKVVEAFLATHRPAVVYTHNRSDLNVDHACVHNAVVTACRPQPGFFVQTLLFFEVPSSTEWNPASAPFVPTWFVDVGATLPRKQEALRCYSSEMRAWPHARSIEAVTHLALWRGASVGMEAAEAFMVGRHLENTGKA